MTAYDDIKSILIDKNIGIIHDENIPITLDSESSKVL